VPKEIDVDVAALAINPISIVSRNEVTRTLTYEEANRTIIIANAFEANQSG
jgi:hypothetical protein